MTMDKEAPEGPGTAPNADSGAANSLVALCAGVLPVWGRHLAASRAQSEVAVGEMLSAFSDIGPHIDMAERQSQQIGEALNPGGITGLAQACEGALSPLLNDPHLSATNAEAIQKVLTMVREAVDALERISKPFAHETKMVAAQVERMYIGFQYQDRISQMMALLEGDIARLQEAMTKAGTDSPNLVDWLAHLESQYAMNEQHNNHSGSAGPGDKPDDNNETTYF